MAFDGITCAAIADEIRRRSLNGRIYKVSQPESDEILLTIKTNMGGTERLVISVSASLPFVYFTDKTKKNPMTAPNFCMLLRKHIQNGRITSVSQPGLERVIRIGIEHLNEMGDMEEKVLVAELMGKHSNIIFTDSKDNIIDSIKHITPSVSSIRTVLPGKPYFIPDTMNKKDPLSLKDEEEFFSIIRSVNKPVFKALYECFTGVSPLIAADLSALSGVDPDIPASSLPDPDLKKLYSVFSATMEDVKAERFSPEIVYDKSRSPLEFSALHLKQYEGYDSFTSPSISSVLEKYYSERSISDRMRQRSADLRKLLSTLIERDSKKYDIQLKQLKSTEGKDKYRIYGELLNTYGYGASPGDRELKCLNYYTNEEIVIPLDPFKSAGENSKKYFERYQKLKRTEEAVKELIGTTKADLDHLLSIQASLDLIENEGSLWNPDTSGEEAWKKGKRRKFLPPFTTFQVTALTYTWERTISRTTT